MLRAPRDLDAGDRDLFQLAAQDLAGLVDEGLAVRPALVDHLLDLAVALGVEGGERQVLEFPLERVDAEAVRQGRVDLERLLGLLDLLGLGHVGQRPHVVQAVGQLDHQHPDVAGHRDDQLAVVLGLVFLLALEVDLRELGDPVHERRGLDAERRLDVGERGGGVLHRVVQQGRHHGRAVQTQAGGDAGTSQRVGDERLTRVAQLRAMMRLGVRVGPPDRVAIYVRVVVGDLGDDLLELGNTRRESQIEVCKILGHASRIPRPAGRPGRGARSGGCSSAHHPEPRGVSRRQPPRRAGCGPSGRA